MKRRRRKASEIRKLRSKLLEAVKKERRITLTDLVKLYGSSIGIRDTVSDKSLAKRQLDILAQEKAIIFRRDGRDLVAAAKPTTLPKPPATASKPTKPRRQEAEGEPPSPTPPAPELQAIRAYAKHVQAFAEALQQQVDTLVRMVQGKNISS